MAIADGKVSLKHLVTMETLTNEEVLGLIRRGGDFKNGRADFQLDRQYFAANLFFENSTRTHKSFEVAEKKLGLDVIEFDAGTSSVNKGETLYDTILTMSALGVDICVVRHSEVDYYKQLIDSRTIQTSIDNGGDGSGQHPSQCLLDLMTIYEEFGTFENLKICIRVTLRIRVSLSQICRFLSVWVLSFILLVRQSGTRMSLMFMVSMWPLTTSLRTWMFSCCFVFSTSVMGMTKDFQKKTTMLSMV